MEFDWGKAVASLVIPIVIVPVVIGCFFLFFIGIVGPVIGDVFEGIIDNLNTMP